MKKSTRILLVILLCLLLIAISVPRFFSFNSYNYDDASRYTAGGCEISQEVKTIDVSWIAGKVHIARHEGDEIVLSETSARRLKANEELHWLLDGDTLYVKYVRSGRNVSSRLDKELTLLLPDDLNLDNVLISSVSAQVEADLPDAEHIDLQSVSGNADVTLRRTKTVRINTVSGNVQLRCASAPSDIDADSVSADVTVYLPEEAGFTARLSSVSGEISSALPGQTDGKTITNGNGECSISMDSVSGRLLLDAFLR